MGLTFIQGIVRGAKKKSVTVEFLVDSGTIYSLLPDKDWRAIGLKPKRKMSFTLADGTKVERLHFRMPHLVAPRRRSYSRYSGRARRRTIARGRDT